MAERSVLITGAGIGIGAATAHAFGAQGYRVYVTDVLDVEGQRVAEEVTEAGGDASFHHLDVTDTDNCNAVVAQAEAESGPLDVVVANAGIAYRVPLADMTDAKWDETMQVDLAGVMRVSRAAVPAMRRAGRAA